MLKFIPSIHTNNYKYKKNPIFCFHWPLIKDHTKKRKPKNEGREALNSYFFCLSGQSWSKIVYVYSSKQNILTLLR